MDRVNLFVKLLHRELQSVTTIRVFVMARVQHRTCKFAARQQCSVSVETHIQSKRGVASTVFEPNFHVLATLEPMNNNTVSK